MLSLLRANWKRVIMVTVWTVVGLYVVYFVQRAMLSDHCGVDAVKKDPWTAVASVNDGCTFARVNSTSPSETNWCVYDDEVDLRIIIMTFSRSASLLHLLRFVNPYLHLATSEM